MHCQSHANGALVIRIAVLVMLLAPSPVYGQPAVAQAEALFRQARDLMAAGKIEQACNAFEQSQKLDPAISTLLNLADCRERNRQIATAWGLFIQAARETRSATDTRTVQLRAVALDRAQKLEARVSKLTVNVSADSTIQRLEILLNDTYVEPGAWNRTLPLDGGTYKITAKAPGAATWTATVRVALESDSKTVDIPKLQVVAASTHKGRRRRPSATSKASLLVVGASSVALLGAAVGFELWGQATYDKARMETDYAKQDELWHSANTKRYIAGGLTVTGVAGAGVAVWLYLRGTRGEARTAMVPVAGADHVGLAVIASF